MKPVLKISVALLFKAIYCFALVVVNTSTGFAVHHGSQVGEEKYLEAVSANLVCYTTLSENGDVTFSNVHGGDCKLSLHEWYAISRITEQFFQASFSQYFRVSENLLVYYRKSDIIFPFHYLW